METSEAIPPAEEAGENPGSLTTYGPWSLGVWPEEDNTAHLHPIPSLGPDAVRVIITKAAGQTVWEIQLSQAGPVSVAERTCVLHFRARADGPRRIGVGFTRAKSPWTQLGLYRQVALTQGWESFREQFTMSADEDDTQIIFHLGRDPASVELARVSLRAVGGAPPAGSAGETAGTGPEPPPADAPAGTLNRPVRAARSMALRLVSSPTLTSEVLARIHEGAFSSDEHSILLGCELQNALREVLDVSRNRWSRLRYREQFQSYRSLPEPWPPLQGATVVDLGCGALNPYGTLFLFLMLGARRGIAVDLDPILDVPRAVRALADLTAMMLVDPKSIVVDYPITRAELLQNIVSFDLPSLGWGEPEGIDPERLIYHRESVDTVSLPDAEADFVFSNATLEHLTDPEEAIREMARITRPGGVGVHILDASDHRTYSNASHHQLEFLSEPRSKGMLYGSNRIRPLEFLPMFEHHGFEVLSFVPFRRVEISDQLLRRFADPWRDMDREALTLLDGRICVRRRP